MRQLRTRTSKLLLTYYTFNMLSPANSDTKPPALLQQDGRPFPWYPSSLFKRLWVRCLMRGEVERLFWPDRVPAPSLRLRRSSRTFRFRRQSNLLARILECPRQRMPKLSSHSARELASAAMGGYIRTHARLEKAHNLSSRRMNLQTSHIRPPHQSRR